MMMIPMRAVLMPVVSDGIVGQMPLRISVLCATCGHWTEGLQCTAYPDGIPDAIWSGGVDHRRPFAGDRGIVYELAHGVTPPPELLG